MQIKDKCRLFYLGCNEKCDDHKEVVSVHRALPVAVEELKKFCYFPVAQVCDTAQDHHKYVFLKVAATPAHFLDCHAEIVVTFLGVHVVEETLSAGETHFAVDEFGYVFAVYFHLKLVLGGRRGKKKEGEGEREFL